MRRKSPEPRVIGFIAGSPLAELYVSSVVFAEIRFRIELADWELRAELHRWLSEEVRPMFRGRVIEISEDVMFRWRMLVEEGRRSGRTFSQPDLIIAATALEHGLTLVTRNVRDFEGLGVDVLNPWVGRA
jgi:predicted nucleic acid-binding protein